MGVLYKKIFVPNVMSNNFLCCYQYLYTDDTSLKVYESAINWINKYQFSIKVKRIDTNTYINKNIVMENGQVTVYYELK